MIRVDQLANDPRVALPQEEVPSEGCALSETALQAIRAVGLLLLGVSVGCFIGSLHIPAIALLVASIALEILGVALKPAAPASTELTPDEVAKIEEFADYLGTHHTEQRLDFMLGEKIYVFAEKETEYVIAPLADWTAGKETGIFISRDAKPFKSDCEPNMVYRCLAGVTLELIRKLAGPESREIFTEAYAFSNFYKAVRKFADTGDLDSTFKPADAADQPPIVARDTFRSAVDPNGRFQQTIQAIEEDPDALTEWEDVAECFQSFLPIAELILKRA